MNEQSSTHEQRAKQACEPCRKKKTKCPGEKPTCSFCRRLDQRCVYLPKDRAGLTFKHKNSSKERLHRLEAHMERLQDSIHMLTERRPDITTANSQMSQTHGQDTLRPESSHTMHLPPLSLSFNAETCPHPPLGEMPYFIEIYRSRLHSQPLPLFNPDSLHEHVARFPQFLLKCFLAAVLPFSEHSFYDSSKSDAMEFYVRSAREAVIPRATEGTGAAELLQSLCLLTLSDIAASNHVRAAMNVCIAARLSKVLDESSKVISIAEEDRSRCCWSIFILEKVFFLGPSILQLDAPPMVYTRSPPSPLKPPAPEILGTSLSTLGSATKDLGILTYCLQLTSIWGDIAGYMRQIRLGQGEEPWLASSKYHKLAAQFYKFESSLAQEHRFKNVGFDVRSCAEISQHKDYWTSWILLQVTFHTGHALLNHPLFHIATPERTTPSFRPPTFLQRVVDEALLHSGWTVRLIRMADNLGHQVNDPFIIHQVITTATVHWVFAFASDDAVAGRACLEFDRCRQFVGEILGKWPQFSRAVNGLDYLRDIVKREARNMNRHGIPAFKVSILWDLLDPASSKQDHVMSPPLLHAAGEPVSTQYLTQLRDSSEPRDQRPAENQSSGAHQYDSAQPSYSMQDILLDEDLFSSFDMPVSPQLQYLPFGDL